MCRIFLLISLLLFIRFGFAQKETRVVDSLSGVLLQQEGREKVLTMIELTWEFYNVSYDDCLDWGEKAIKEAQALGFTDLEADATYALGMQYGYHADLDLAQDYLKKAFVLHESVGNDARAFEDLWNQAYFEQFLGNMDSAFGMYEKVLSYAEQRGDTLAMANTLANMGVIQYQIHDFARSEMNFKKSRSLHLLMDNILEVARVNANLASLYMEWGKYAESRKLYRQAISAFEHLERNDLLLLAYKNYGILFEKTYVNYDSASYFFEKAMACTDQVKWTKQVINAKADLLVEMGNLAAVRCDETTAKNLLEEAFSLAKDNSYHFGMMQAALSLGQLYASQGKAVLSLHYLDVYAKEASRSGITMMESVAKKPLILNYARLGRFDEMAAELEALDDHTKALQHENSDLHDQISTLHDETQGLIELNEFQNEQIETLQAQRNQYRLAFFGLLAMVIATLVLLTAYKIVRKNRPKI